MICRNCGVKLDDGLDKCPYCGTNVKKEEIIEISKSVKDEFELPNLKQEEIIELDDNDTNLSDNDFEIELKDAEETEDFDKFEGIDDVPDEDNNSKEKDDAYEDIEVSLEKTRSISPIEDNDEMNSLSLIDDINKQIEIVNDEANSVGEITSDETEEINNENQNIEHNELATEDSVKKRKNILIITGVFCLALAMIILAFLFFKNTKEEATPSTNYLENLNSALQKFYDTEEIDDVIYVLEDIKKDEDKIKEVQQKTRITCDSWILLYLNEDIMDKERFDEVSNKYKSLIDGLHNDAMIKYNDIRIKALTDSDYEELSLQIDNIYSDSSMFLEALDYYNKKDYNRAYYDFDRIDEKNSYYEKAISYKNKIVDNILDLLNEDIKKIENNLDVLTDEEKLQIYLSVEEIILEYNNVYVSVNLSLNSDYQELLGIYTSNVSLYTEKVSNTNKQNDKQDNPVNDNNQDTNVDDNINNNPEIVDGE